MADNYRFNESDSLLCYHGPMLYEAKCLKRRKTNEGKAQYFIHYKGWNSKWEEWVDDDRVLTVNTANMNKMASLKEIHSNSKKGTTKRSTTVIKEENVRNTTTTTKGRKRKYSEISSENSQVVNVSSPQEPKPKKRGRPPKISITRKIEITKVTETPEITTSGTSNEVTETNKLIKVSNLASESVKSTDVTKLTGTTKETNKINITEPINETEKIDISEKVNETQKTDVTEKIDIVEKVNEVEKINILEPINTSEINEETVPVKSIEPIKDTEINNETDKIIPTELEVTELTGMNESTEINKSTENNESTEINESAEINESTETNESTESNDTFKHNVSPDSIYSEVEMTDSLVEFITNFPQFIIQGRPPTETRIMPNYTMPLALKKILAKDYYKIKVKKQVLVFPIYYTIERLIRSYVCSKNFDDGIEREKALCMGLTFIQYFNRLIHDGLLYHEEALIDLPKQAKKNLKLRIKRDTVDFAFIKILSPKQGWHYVYQPTYLLRLLVHLPSLIAKDPDITNKALESIVRNIEEFMLFTVRYVERYFSENTYRCM